MNGLFGLGWNKMTQEFVDKEQSKRLDKLEQEVVILKVQLAEILTEMRTLMNIGKVVALVAGAAVGVDVIPMLNS